MSKYSESSVIPAQVQQLFSQIYTELLNKVQKQETSDQVQQLQTENEQLRSQLTDLEQMKAELKGMLFAFSESQKQVEALAQENEQLKQGETTTTLADDQPSSKITLAGQTWTLPTSTAEALNQELQTLQTEITSLKEQQKSSKTSKTKTSKSKSTKAAAKASEKTETPTPSPATAKEETPEEPTGTPEHGWELGTQKMQSELTKAKVLTRAQTDRTKKVGTKLIGKDNSIWEFTGRNRARNNAKIYECVG